jgi:hypothetical protein
MISLNQLTLYLHRGQRCKVCLYDRRQLNTQDVCRTVSDYDMIAINGPDGVLGVIELFRMQYDVA